MAERSRLFDDLAGVAGGAFSVLLGVREETEAALKARFDELTRRLDVASQTDLEAVKELAAKARTASEGATERLDAIALRLDALGERLDALERRLGGGDEHPPAPEA